MGEKSIRVPVKHERDRALVTSKLRRFCREVGLREHDALRCMTAVSELTSNIVKFAGSGVVNFLAIEEPGRIGVDVVATDSGGGIPNVADALQDSFSTAKTMGLGLPGTRRLTDFFHIESQPGFGTTVRVKVWSNDVPMGEDIRTDLGRYVRPMPGQKVAGDFALTLQLTSESTRLCLADVAGHGERAHSHALAIESIVTNSVGSQLEGVVGELQRGIAQQRHVAIFLADLNLQTRQIDYILYGDVHARILGLATGSLLGQPGMLGLVNQSPKRKRQFLKPGHVLVVCSDGIRSSWDTRLVSRMSFRSAADIAQFVVQRFGKAHDDASCLVVK